MFQQVNRNLKNWRKTRTTMNELSALSDRELADLGISRADIKAIARQSTAL